MLGAIAATSLIEEYAVAVVELGTALQCKRVCVGDKVKITGQEVKVKAKHRSESGTAAVQNAVQTSSRACQSVVVFSIWCNGSLRAWREFYMSM